MAYFHNTVRLDGFHWEDSSLTWNLAAGIVHADIGKAVSVDTTGPNKVKLAGVGDHIIGRLSSVEDRQIEGIRVGAVELQFANKMTIASGQTVVVGDTAVGSGNGEIRAAATPNHSVNVVTEVVGNQATVVKV